MKIDLKRITTLKIIDHGNRLSNYPSSLNLNTNTNFTLKQMPSSISSYSTFITDLCK